MNSLWQHFICNFILDFEKISKSWDTNICKEEKYDMINWKVRNWFYYCAKYIGTNYLIKKSLIIN